MTQAQIFIDKDDMKEDKPLYRFILNFLIEHEVRGATVFEGFAGFGSNHYVQRPGLFSFDETPIVITFIDDDHKVSSVLDLLKYETHKGFIVTHSVTVWNKA
jgi:PII-like signaling protein